jgi:hypothetical protein
MKSFAKLAAVFLATLTVAAYSSNAQTGTPPTSSDTNSAAAPVAKPKPKGKRYVGKIDSVDTSAKTITFTTKGGVTQTLQVTSRTRIHKDGQPATLDDVAASIGERISGTERMDSSSNWVASTVLVGQPRPRPSTNAPPATATPPQ